MPTSRAAPRERKKGPGRPEGSTTSREDILDASEFLFAELGFAGTTLRHVAEKIGVTTALINYYFKSKDKLFREVFLRKGTLIAQARAEGLRALLARKQPPDVEALVRAFLEPPLSLRADAQGRAFLRLHSRLHMEPEALSYQMRSQVYDATTRAFAEAFLKALPHLDAETVYMRISLMIGSYLYTFSDTNRLDELLPGTGITRRAALELDEIVTYASAGMRAGAASGP